MSDSTIFEKGEYKGLTYDTVRTEFPEFLFHLMNQKTFEVIHYLEFIQYCMSYLTSPIDSTTSSISSTYTSAPSSPIIQPTKDEDEDEDEDEVELPEYKMYFDGCSKGNPGRSGAGAVLYENDKEIWSNKKFVSDSATNNVAEYNGLILALQELAKRNLPKVSVYGDSSLIIQQIKGLSKTRAKTLRPLYDRAIHIKKQIKYPIEFIHVLRNYNKRADKLANDAVKPTTQ